MGSSTDLQGVIQRPTLVPNSSSPQSSPGILCFLDTAPGDLCIVGKSSLQALGPSPKIPAGLSETPETSGEGGDGTKSHLPSCPKREKSPGEAHPCSISQPVQRGRPWESCGERAEVTPAPTLIAPPLGEAPWGERWMAGF